jgi:hypothetical protein
VALYLRGRHILDLIGLSVTLFSCVFVGKIVLEYWQTWPSVNGIAFAGPLIALSLIYLCAIASVAAAWHQLLLWAGCRQISFFRAVLIYGMTQIAKYVPSNVVHYIGRYSQARKYGATIKEVAFSSVAEIGLIALSGVALAIAGNVDVLNQAIHIPTPVLWAGLGLSVLPVLFWRSTGAIVYRFKFFHGFDWSERGRLNVLATICCYFVFFLVSGVILFIILQWLASPALPPSLLNVVSVSALAWTLGFAVPGSPGGIGVREAVLVIALGDSVGTAQMGLIAVTYRGVTVLGDLWFFLICMLGSRMADRRTA